MAFMWVSECSSGVAGRFPAGGWSHKTVYFKSLICNVQSTVTLLRACVDEHEQSCMPRTGQSLATGPSIEGLGSDARPGPSPYPQIDEFITSICTEVYAAVLCDL
jgi:hypothetical protein